MSLERFGFIQFFKYIVAEHRDTVDRTSILVEEIASIEANSALSTRITLKCGVQHDVEGEEIIVTAAIRNFMQRTSERN